MSVATCAVKELSVFLLSDGSLHRVDSLFDKDTVLNIEDTICIAFQLWVMSDHDTGSTCMFSLSTRANTIDIQ